MYFYKHWKKKKTESALSRLIKAMIVNPKCKELRERARWEAGPEYFDTPVFFDSTTFIETDGAARIAKRLYEKYKNDIEIKMYVQAPTAFVLLTSRFVFIESYSYASRGSNVPILQVKAGSSLYAHYESHFDRIWNFSESISNYQPLEYQKE